MKGKYKAAIALVLVLVLLPLTLLLTLTHWVPTLAGIWLPVGTRISLQESPHLTRSALLIPDLRYLVGDCVIARVTDARLSRPSRWRLHIGQLEINSACLSKLPASDPSPGSPRTLAEWQSMLPYSWLTIDNLRLSPWEKWQGRLVMSLTPAQQDIGFAGKELSLQARLRGQALTVSQFSARLTDDQPPVKLVGTFHLPLVPDGLPVDGQMQGTFEFPQTAEWIDAELEWQHNRGQLLVTPRGEVEPILDLPWEITPERITLHREGTLNSEMIFQEGQKHFSLYETPYGGLMLGVNTHRAKADFGEDGGNLSIRYALEVDSQPIGENAFEIRVTEPQLVPPAPGQ